MALQWDKLSPTEFQQLQDLAAYSTKKLQDVLVEFCGSGPPYKHNPDGEIDYETFRSFLDNFLEVHTPEELCRHLFLSFVRRGVRVEGKAFKEMAVLSSTTACAPITSHNKGKEYRSKNSCASEINGDFFLAPEGSSPNVHAITDVPEKAATYGEIIAEKIHGIGEKLLGHHRSDSDSSN